VPISEESLFLLKKPLDFGVQVFYNNKQEVVIMGTCDTPPYKEVSIS